MLVGELKDFLSIKIKYRSDSFCDQYSRILVMKILLVCSSIMGISWFRDSINCIVPPNAEMDPGFVSQACWIQGVFVYRELQNTIDYVGYYGIPRDIELDVPIVSFLHGSISVVLLSTIYLISDGQRRFDKLEKKTVISDESTPEIILSTYFNRTSNPKLRLRLIILYNYVIKILYIIVNVASFLVTDKVLLGEFKRYGTKWMQWSKLPITLAYDYMGTREFPKPDNELLPPFGYCEVYESAKNVKTSLANKHRFVCELLQNILYQYCLIIVWFLIVIGIVVSVIGFLILFF